MEYKVGDIVEVCSKEEGFVGSYYKAKVVKQKGKGGYDVVYKNLLKEDESGPLVETVSWDEVRPLPPRPPAHAFTFRLHDTVDAFDNDGWWVGEIRGMKEDKYLVYFCLFGNQIAYPISHLRPHLEWINDDWVVP